MLRFVAQNETRTPPGMLREIGESDEINLTVLGESQRRHTKGWAGLAGAGPGVDRMSSGSEDPGVGDGRAGPFLSVLVTAYRRRQYLLEAVRSVVATSLDPAEYEVVVLKDFADPAIDSELARLGTQVRVVNVDLPRMGDALARGIREARGNVVSFLEDDDRFLPGKLESVIAQFRTDPGLGFLRNAYRAIDASGRPVEGWEKFRPPPPRSRTLDPRDARSDDLPWVFRYSPNVNVSTMTIRAELLRPWFARLEQVTAALDSFLFTVAMVSDLRSQVQPDLWNEYRVHASLSHSAIAEGTEQLDLTDTARSLPTADLMARIVAERPGHDLARRFTHAFRREVEVNIFLLDERARLSVGEWVGFLRTAFARRQKYLLVPWVYCVYRWLAPGRAIVSYRNRRTRTLRAAAARPAK